MNSWPTRKGCSAGASTRASPSSSSCPDRGLVSIQPVESDDDLVNDLIEHNAALRILLAKSLASPREPFPISGSEEHQAIDD